MRGYALGHGLRSEYKDTKDGILYSKTGYESVISVKSKILSEEAILKDKRESIKKEQLSQNVSDDEIALKVDASKPKQPPKTKSVTFDMGQFTKGKDGKKGGQRGQRQWADRSSSEESWVTTNNWQQYQQSWSSPPNSSGMATTKGQCLATAKGKGKQSNRSRLWCDIHQAYGHSTDWCYSNPNESGGPPKLEWCDHHQTYGHSTEACRKGNGPPSQPQPPKGHTPSAKGGKGKTKDPNRAWKSENFPANYDQATPVLQEDNHREWWETEDELSSVCFQDLLFDSTSMAIFDEDELDEDSSNLLDIHFLSITHQLERQKQYRMRPSLDLQLEIRTHAEYIQFAGSLLDPRHQQVIARFSSLVGYSTTEITEIDSSKDEPYFSPALANESNNGN